MRSLSFSSSMVRVRVVVLPELVPGRFVEVSKLEAMANRKYYLKRVNHRINEEGFITEFETGGWA